MTKAFIHLDLITRPDVVKTLRLAERFVKAWETIAQAAESAAGAYVAAKERDRRLWDDPRPGPVTVGGSPIKRPEDLR